MYEYHWNLPSAQNLALDKSAESIESGTQKREGEIKYIPGG